MQELGQRQLLHQTYLTVYLASQAGGPRSSLQPRVTLVWLAMQEPGRPRVVLQIQLFVIFVMQARGLRPKLFHAIAAMQVHGPLHLALRCRISVLIVMQVYGPLLLPHLHGLNVLHVSLECGHL